MAKNMDKTQGTPHAVVLLSGGLDSATVLALARRDGFTCHTLAVDYGQRHAVELRAAARVARALGASTHRVIAMDLRAVGGSALTAEEEVPKDRPAHQVGADVPVTYVPARNAVLLSLALGLAEVVGAADLFLGVNARDYSGYPDCRPDFVAAFERLANVATAAATEQGVRFKVHAPLMTLGKAEIIRLGTSLGVDYGLTHSCYDPVGGEGLACGRCDACHLRREGFSVAGVPDPTAYAPGGPCTSDPVV
jgi:7-cyano-7-deazaguanine synthase